MADKVPGSLCAFRVGVDWIDEGTSCRARSSVPAPVGRGFARDEIEAPEHLTDSALHATDPFKSYYSDAPNAMPAVAVERFEGTGPNKHLGPGMTDMLQADLSSVGGDFRPAVVEWERRAELAQEVDLSNSPCADPATRIAKGKWIEPDVFIRGSVDTRKDETTWNLRIDDRKTGEIVGTDRGKAKGTDILKATGPIAERLVKQIEAYWRKTHPARKKDEHKPPRLVS